MQPKTRPLEAKFGLEILDVELAEVMMWDNSRLQYRRDPYDAALPRLAKRTTIFFPPEQFPVPYTP